MTSAAPLVYYPQYCFHLSPTINNWCPLRGKDIAGLECRPGFSDIDVYFYLNYPIRWVRIVGVVVAIDDFYGHRVYTVDDSTGQCIECALAVPKTSGSKMIGRDNGQDKDPGRHTDSTKTAIDGQIGKDLDPTASETPAFPYSDIDVGMVLDVKGSIKTFRGQKQIKIQKLKRVLSTNQEVLFWHKIRDFHHDTLSHPWILKDREVRRCRKLQQIEAVENERKKKKRKKAREIEEAKKTTPNGSGTHLSKNRSRATGTSVGKSAKNAKTQSATRPETFSVALSKGIKYDALGL